MDASVEPHAAACGDVAVRGFLHLPIEPSGDGLILAHGAGSNCQAPLLVNIARRFAEAGVTVLRCDLPFRQERPRGSPSPAGAARDREGLRCAARHLRSRAARRIYLAGHSYGGRQATMLAADDPAVADGLLLLSYPLHPPRKPEQLRVAHFPKLQTPALFIHGARDPFGSPEEMKNALDLIPGPKRLVTIDGAGHELSKSRSSAGFVQFSDTVFERFQEFLAR